MAEIFNFYVQDNRSIQFPKANLLEPIMQEDHNVAVWRFRIPKTLNNIDMSGWAWWFVYVNAKGQKFTELLTLVDDIDEPDEYCTADYSIDYGVSYNPGSFAFSLESVNADVTGAILQEWHTKTYHKDVDRTLQGNQVEFAETESDIISALIIEVQNKVSQLVGGATPEPKNLIADMTDTKKVYLYVGSETGESTNYWYYYNGSAWVPGGLYASGITIDSVPTQGSSNAVSSGGVYSENSEIRNSINDANILLNTLDGKIKNVPFRRSGTVNGVAVEYVEGKVRINGTLSSTLVLEADADAALVGEEREIPARNGATSGLFEDNANARKVHVDAGRYRLVYNMLSGTVTKGGVTYTSNEQFGTTNVVNAFVLTPDASSSGYTLIKSNITTEVDLEDGNIGIQILYCYNGCSFDNAVFELYLEKVVEEELPDTTLTEEGKPADAKATGDAIKDVNRDVDDAQVLINASTNKVKNIPLYRSGTAGELTVEYKYGKVTINGTLTQNAIVLEADADRVYTGATDLEIPARQGMNSGLFEDNALARRIPIQTGQYRFVFNMLSGSVTKGGITYTSNEQFGTTNVINAFLLKSDASSEGYTLIKTNVTTEEILDVTEIGMQVLYCYKGCSFDNAVFELYLEKVEEEPIPYYWNSEIDRAVSQIQSNIINASAVGSTTVCFVTDCHWKTNEKHSPYIIKDIFSKCNVNYFVNGGDILYRHTTTKQEAIDEITDCINAFRICGKPMITLYGNHDRNRNANSEHPEAYLSHSEHANIVFKSFMPNPHIIRVSSDFAAFYWEDDVYRYVCIYWFLSTSHALPEAQEICNTTKPVIIFCHGIYYSLGATTASDVMDGEWVLNAFEPYKAKIKCFVQGHTHVDGIRHAWGTVPIIVIDCDTVNTYSTVGTITEQAIAFITFDTDKISIVKVGRGEDFVVTADSADWRQEYTSTVPDENSEL